jgi:hypothetical protein
MDRVLCVSSILRADPHRWHFLGVVAALELPDCWIGAGFVRNAVWDHLHQRSAMPICGDVDVIWYDPRRADAIHDREFEALLRVSEPSIIWSVKNQARMHVRNGDAPYSSATDAMRFWPETATAIAARRTHAGDCEIAAPFGLHDMFDLVLRPTPRFEEDKRSIYEERIQSKSWRDAWPLLTRIEI